MAVSVPDLSLLALVQDDPLAPVVLAWWKARRPGRALVAVSGSGRAWARLDPDAVAELCRVSMKSPFHMKATLERCEIAGLFESADGGISEIADKWLRTHVAQQLGAGRGRPPAVSPAPPPAPKRRERGSVALAVVVAMAAAAVMTICVGPHRSVDEPIGSPSHQVET